MSKKVSATLTVIVLMSLFGAPVAAMAHETRPVTGPSNVHIHQDDSEDHEDQGDGDDDGDDEGKDRKKGWIPPVFVVPGKKHDHKAPKPEKQDSGTAPVAGSDDSGNSTAGSASINGLDTNDFVVVGVEDTAGTQGIESANPRGSKPVAIEQVKVTTQTPADRFMDSAYLGIGLLALAAVGLGATTAIRSYRLRKSGKSDYFYDN